MPALMQVGSDSSGSTSAEERRKENKHGIQLSETRPEGFTDKPAEPDDARSTLTTTDVEMFSQIRLRLFCIFTQSKQRASVSGSDCSQLQPELTKHCNRKRNDATQVTFRKMKVFQVLFSSDVLADAAG